MCKIILTSTLAHAREAHPRLNPNFVREEGELKFDLGSACHALLLEGGKGIRIINPAHYPAKNGNIPKGWTNPSIQAARDDAYAAGMVPVLPDQFAQVEAMAISVKDQVKDHEEMVGWLNDGCSEVTLIWRDLGGIWCRARVDWMPSDPRRIWCDLKTTGTTANPASLGRFAADQGWDIQDAFYRRGIKALGLAPSFEPQFRFGCVETYPPYCFSVVGIPPEEATIADRRVDVAMRRWELAMRSGEWPGYPKKTCWIDFPPWARASALEAITGSDNS
jgi:hypothetical protein